MDKQPEILVRKHSWLALVGWLAVCYFVAGVSGYFTAQQIPTWYAGIVKPSFNPPNWVFGPVWSVLYALMGIAAWLVWRLPSTGPQSSARRRALKLFWTQLFLNFSWSFLFFKQHWVLAAAVEVVVLWLAILLMTRSYLKVSKAAAGMMVPYLGWVGFASALNWAVWWVNR